MEAARAATPLVEAIAAPVFTSDADLELLEAERDAEREVAAAKFLAEMSRHRCYGQVLETDDAVFFWKPKSAFDQWTPCRFEVAGVIYNCSEQFMMAEKARLFEDLETRERILREYNPAQQKFLASKKGPLRNFDPVMWDRHCEAIVEAGNMAKYMQNSDLRDELLATGDKMLVEASPMDNVWGIGLEPEVAKRRDPKTWPGRNLLGKVLMRVRAQLRAEAETILDGAGRG